IRPSWRNRPGPCRIQDHAAGRCHVPEKTSSRSRRADARAEPSRPGPPPTLGRDSLRVTHGLGPLSLRRVWKRTVQGWSEEDRDGEKNSFTTSHSRSDWTATDGKTRKD